MLTDKQLKKVNGLLFDIIPTDLGDHSYHFHIDWDDYKLHKEYIEDSSPLEINYQCASMRKPEKACIAIDFSKIEFIGCSSFVDNRVSIYCSISEEWKNKDDSRCIILTIDISKKRKRIKFYDKILDSEGKISFYSEYNKLDGEFIIDPKSFFETTKDKKGELSILSGNITKACRY